MQMTPWPFWFRMVSMAIAVLPVLRSPMISSRWPRPMGVMASMALMPVCNGSCTRFCARNAGGDRSHVATLGGKNGPFAVQRVAERIDHAAYQGGPHRHAQQAPGGFDFVP